LKYIFSWATWLI